MARHGGLGQALLLQGGAGPGGPRHGLPEGEQGGQAGDCGTLAGPGGALLRVEDTRRAGGAVLSAVNSQSCEGWGRGGGGGGAAAKSAQFLFTQLFYQTTQ